jgi:hypothetical protein
MTMTHQGTAAGQPAVILSGIVTEQDRAIVTRREAGETRKAICAALGVKVGEVQRAEYRCRNDSHGRELLANRPDSIEGLSWIGELDGNAADQLHYHHYHHECSALEGLSDVASLGRLYVSRIAGIGPKSLASIDRALSLFSMTWSPVDRWPKRQPRQQPAEPPSIDPAILAEVVSRVENLERVSGCGSIFENNPERDTYEFVRGRLLYLTGYICGSDRQSPKDTLRQRCAILEERLRSRGLNVEPEPEPIDIADLETAGNIVCLPGVRLADVLPQNGGAA